MSNKLLFNAATSRFLLAAYVVFLAVHLGIEVLRRINKPTLILSPPPRPPAPFAATGGADPGYRRKF